MPNKKALLNRLRLRIADYIDLAFILGFIFWIGVVLQDWLFSPLEPYPYDASSLNALGISVGFVCFLRVRRLILWRNVVLWGVTFFLAVAALGFASYQGSVVSIGALLCGLTTAPLLLDFTAKKKLGCQHFLFFGVFLIVAALIVCRAYVLQNLVWGVLVVLMTVSTSALGVFIARGRKLLGRSSALNLKSLPFFLAAGNFLLFGSLLVLALSLISPSDWSTTATVWQGEGFGKNTFSASWLGASSFVPVIVQEQGMFSLWVLMLLFGAALAAGTLVLSNAALDTDDDEAVQQCQANVETVCGALGALAGILLGAHLGPPFLTLDSVGGTWALSLTVASLGIAATPRPVWQKAEFFGTKKQSFFVVSSVVILAFMGAAFYWNALREAVQPFAGNGPIPKAVSYVPLSEVSLVMQDATVAMEDGHFYEHHGIDWAAMHRALRLNMRKRHMQQGGSTITQQLSKNLFHSWERTVTRKIEEAALASEIERQLPKQRILEIYLNVIPYGMRQHGISAAARYYFHKTPSHLTLSESAILVGLVPKPPRKKLILQDLASGREKALRRIAGVWPDRYSTDQIEKAMRIPIDHLVYPFKITWDHSDKNKDTSQ